MDQSPPITPISQGTRLLHSLLLRSIRCFKTTVVPLDARVTVIIGENGSGKTTIAEAISSLCYGEEEGLDVFPLRRGSKSGAIELRGTSDGPPIAWWRHGSENEDRHRLPHDRLLFAYGRYRRVQFPEPTFSASLPLLGAQWSDAYTRQPVTGTDILGQSSRRRTITLTHPDNHLLRDVGDYLRALLEQQKQGELAIKTVVDRLAEWLFHLHEGLDGVELVAHATRVVPVIRRLGVPLELRQLSDGYQALLVIVFDLIFRLMHFYPKLDDPFQGMATVIVDEVDLHLHPRWQRTVVDQLARLFPAVQFVLTTHSPAVVQGAIDAGHSIVVLHEQRQGTVASMSQVKNLRGAEISSLLVDRRLFGVRSRYSPHFERYERKARRLRRKVDRGLATNEDRAKLLSTLDKLHALQVAEERRGSKGPMLSEIAKSQIAMLKMLDAKIGRK